MPVVKQSTIAYFLVNLTINTEAGSAAATFRRYIDGKPDIETVFSVEQADFAPLMLGIADAGKNRRDDIADAVYALAIAKGVLEGLVT